MQQTKKRSFCVPIWLSNWTFKDSKNRIYKLQNQVVKGYTKEEIFENKRIVEKLVNKIKGKRSKQKLVPLNLTLLSQHGFGVEEN